MDKVISMDNWKSKQTDYLVRATAADGQIRAFASYTRHLVQKAREIHETSPVVTAALGRLLTAGTIMGAMLKGEEDLLTLIVRGNGPMQGMTVTADSKGRVKGFPYENNVWIDLKATGKLDVGKAVGRGTLTVVRDQGLKEPYSSQVELQSGEIGDDLTYYFATSEQVPSSVGLGVLVDRDLSVRQAGGFLIQLMPGCTDEVIAQLEERLSGMSSITEMLEDGMLPEEILEKILAGLDPVCSERMPLSFYCGCSRERVSRALLSLGRVELQKMIDDGKPVDLQCHFCRHTYGFTTDEIRELMDHARE